MSKLKVSEVLQRALDSFFNGRRWIKDDYAIDKGTEYEDPTKDNKERVYAEGAYCAVGAIQALHLPTEVEDKAIDTLACAVSGDKPGAYTEGDGEDTVVQYNDSDSTTWAKIKQKFEKAIRLAEKEETKPNAR